MDATVVLKHVKLPSPFASGNIIHAESYHLLVVGQLTGSSRTIVTMSQVSLTALNNHAHEAECGVPAGRYCLFLVMSQRSSHCNEKHQHKPLIAPSHFTDAQGKVPVAVPSS